MLSSRGRLVAKTLWLGIAIALSLTSIAYSAGAASQWIHWQTIELVGPDAIWQIHTQGLNRTDCVHSAAMNSIDFETQHDPKSYDIGLSEFDTGEEKKYINRLTISYRDSIVMTAWNVCLQVGELPDLESLKKEVM